MLGTYFSVKSKCPYIHCHNESPDSADAYENKIILRVIKKQILLHLVIYQVISHHTNVCSLRYHVLTKFCFSSKSCGDTRGTNNSKVVQESESNFPVFVSMICINSLYKMCSSGWVLQGHLGLLNLKIKKETCYSFNYEHLLSPISRGKREHNSPRTLSASALSCSEFSARLVTEENCQLKTFDSCPHFTDWGFKKNVRFWERERQSQNRDLDRRQKHWWGEMAVRGVHCRACCTIRWSPKH